MGYDNGIAYLLGKLMAPPDPSSGIGVANVPRAIGGMLSTGADAIGSAVGPSVADFSAGLKGIPQGSYVQPPAVPQQRKAVSELANPKSYLHDDYYLQQLADPRNTVQAQTPYESQAEAPENTVQAEPRSPLMFSMDGAPMTAYDPNGRSVSERLGTGAFNSPQDGSRPQQVRDQLGGPSVTAPGIRDRGNDGGANVSMIQGTPEIQARLAVEDAQRRAAVGQAEANARQYEVPESTPSMPNELGLTRQELIQAMIAAMKQRQDPTMGILGTNLDIGKRSSDELMAAIAQAEKNIPDPTARAAAVQDIQSRWKLKWEPYFRALESARGIRPQESY